MGLFDSIQNLINGAGDSVQGSIGDVVSGIGDVPGLQELQDQASTLSDGASEVVNSATEQGQSIAEDVTNNLGL